MEVMIALAVFAIVSTTLIKNATNTVYQTRALQEKTLAFFIAENEMNQLRIDRDPDQFPAIGTRRKTVSMSGQDWRVSLRFVRTENEHVRRVEVSVASDDQPDSQIASIAGFLGRY